MKIDLYLLARTHTYCGTVARAPVTQERNLMEMWPLARSDCQSVSLPLIVSSALIIRAQCVLGLGGRRVICAQPMADDLNRSVWSQVCGCALFGTRLGTERSNPKQRKGYTIDVWLHFFVSGCPRNRTTDVTKTRNELN